MLATLAACTFDASGLVAGGGSERPPAQGTPDAGANVGVPPPNADPYLGCATGCHGDTESTAPPRDVSGETSTSRPTVGAHRSHLGAAPTWYRRVDCEDCHRVPAEVSDPGHMDSSPAEVIFSALADKGGGDATWSGDTCASVYCHGATLEGGSSTEPQWTVVDGSQSACGSCHGLPPPSSNHQPGDTDCGTCHPTIQPGSDPVHFLDPASHINGTVETTADATACDACHGSDGISAPPFDLDGGEDRGSPGVGAHREHIGPSTWHRELFCAQCHVVPINVGDEGHMDGDDLAEITFDGLNPDARYNATNATCSELYCHGNGWSRRGTQTWTDDLELGCDGCHDDGRDRGRTMSGEHRRHIDKDVRCSECHGAVVSRELDIIDPNLHVNGVHEVDMGTDGEWDPSTRRCSDVACHDDDDDDDDDGDDDDGEGGDSTW